jgi:hypothetical protein
MRAADYRGVDTGEVKVTDTERLDWLQRQHILHRAVNFLYVVNGYHLDITYYGRPIAMYARRPTLREAIDAAMVDNP